MRLPRPGPALALLAAILAPAAAAAQGEGSPAPELRDALRNPGLMPYQAAPPPERPTSLDRLEAEMYRQQLQGSIRTLEQGAATGGGTEVRERLQELRREEERIERALRDMRR